MAVVNELSWRVERSLKKPSHYVKCLCLQPGTVFQFSVQQHVAEPYSSLLNTIVRCLANLQQHNFESINPHHYCHYSCIMTWGLSLQLHYGVGVTAQEHSHLL